MRSAKDGWVTIKADDPTVTIPVSATLLQSRIEFQKRRFLDRHQGLIKSVQKLIGDLHAAQESLERYEVANYNSLAVTLGNATRVACEANALDVLKEQLAAIEGRT